VALAAADGAIWKREMLEEATIEELTIFRRSVRHFLQSEVAPNRDHWRRQGWIDRSVWRSAGAKGLLLAGLPSEYGGGGGNFRHEAVIVEELANIAFLDFSTYLHSIVVAPYIFDFGTEQQRRRWLPGMASGERIGAIAMSEPSTGSDLRAIRTTAVAISSGFRIKGQKTFISNGLIADLFIVACKTRDAGGRDGLSLFVIEKGAAGFEVGRLLEKVGRKAQDTVELFFDDVEVAEDALLGELNGGLRLLMSKLGSERLLIAVQAVSSIEAALRETIQYVKQRDVFGKKVFDFQNTKFVLAEAKTEAEIARIFIDDCINELIAGKLTDHKAAMAKWWTSEKQCQIIDGCLQLFGGYGYMAEYPISILWTDARVQKIYGGTNEIMKEIISRTL
jgi:acyl-CoA dehydrogenase